MTDGVSAYAAPGTARRRGPSANAVLAIAALGASVAFVDATIVNIAFPAIARSFPATPISTLSWILNVYNIVFAAFLVVAGRLADLLGRRRVFVLGLELFTGASLLCAAAPSVSTLIAFRAAQGLGAAFLVPSSLALVLDAFPASRRSHGVALLSAVAAAAAGLGPSLGGLLVSLSGWRLVFLVNIPIGAAAIVLARTRLVESRVPGRRRMPDILGALLFALAIAALVLGIVKGQEWGWSSARVLGSLIAAAILAAMFLRRCATHRSPIIDLELLRVRTFTAANGMTIAAAAGFYGYTLTNVLFLTGVWRYSVLQAGLALTPGPFVAAAVAGPTSRLAARLGHRPVLVAGGLIWGSAVMWFIARAGLRADFLGVWLPGMFMLGLGAGTLFPNLSGAAVASAPGVRFGTATGLNSVARQLGAALGVAVVIAILSRPAPHEALAVFDDAWRFAAACLLLAGLGCLLVGRVQPDEESGGTGDRSAVALPDGALSASVGARARRVLAPADAGSTRAETATDFLGRVPLLASVEGRLLAELAARARSVHLESGAWLFHEGEAGDAMYVVRAGRIAVVEEDSGAVIRELGRGEALGELALLSGAPRSAGARAARASDLLVIHRSTFDELLQRSPELSLALNRILAEQLRRTRAPAPTRRALPATVALVALDDGVPLAEIAARLGRAVRAIVPAAVLDGNETAEATGDGAAAAIYGPLIDRAEAASDLVVLVAGAPGEGPWSEFCLQHADRILAVTTGASVPERLAARTDLHGCDLVGYAVQAGAGRLTACARALDPVETHLLRERELDADVERMARRLTGRSIGIVLSGGGARAFAHIGVLEELTAAGVNLDRVAGVSMGAFVGALFASGLDAEEIDALCFEEWVQRRPLADYTIPRRALIRGQRAEAMLRRAFGELAIEELPRSFMCGYAELRSGRFTMARHGSLWENVAFSMCLPVLAPPQVRGRDLYVDGSMVDNLPAGSMADLGEGPIIAVDVKASFERPGGSERREQAPSLGETLTRVLLLGSSDTSRAARAHADLIIKPSPAGVGLFEFHQLDAARQAGREAAREALQQGTLPLAG